MKKTNITLHYKILNVNVFKKKTLKHYKILNAKGKFGVTILNNYRNYFKIRSFEKGQKKKYFDKKLRYIK